MNSNEQDRSEWGWGKWAWWLFLFLLHTSFLVVRLPDFFVGNSTAFDVVVFVVWLGLALSLLFQEVNVFGVGLKREVRQLRDAISNLRVQMQSQQQVNVQQQFQFPQPAAPQTLSEEQRNQLLEQLQRQQRQTQDLQNLLQATYLEVFDWKFKYLDLFFAPITKCVLVAYNVQADPPGTRQELDNTLAVSIPDANQRTAIIDALITNGLLDATGGLHITPQGRAYLISRGLALP